MKYTCVIRSIYTYNLVDNNKYNVVDCRCVYDIVVFYSWQWQNSNSYSTSY